jgi:hypothetical protein
MKLGHYLNGSKAIRFPQKQSPLIVFTKLLCPQLLCNKVQDKTPKLAKENVFSVLNEVNNKMLISKKKKDDSCLDDNCRNPSLGFATKAKAYKGAGQE